MSEAPQAAASALVTVTIDGKPIQVPKGTNIIEAAKNAGIDIPHYCYHKHLSVAGNCRMCQIAVKGQPKLNIACNTGAADGMEVSTQVTSKEVADAQAATLEFILINHPLDCTVCDQAGHCKLQDYHFEYNARSSRFLEQKVRKVKAVPLGPTVMLDGERCIMCTRCIRFCDEVTKTSELGMLNRGDQSVIAVSPGRELSNPLSGSVVDLCPVGALTHRKWRFNTRIWFTNQKDSICPGCSTGCNVRVAERDGEIVQVKARLNSDVNKEWLCDEGRYGFDRFLPRRRITESYRNEAGGTQRPATLNEIFAELKGALKSITILVAPDLLLEEYFLLRQLLVRSTSSGRVVVAFRERSLTETEAILISPDYAANFKGALLSGLGGKNIEADYADTIARIRRREIEQVLVLGDRAVASPDIDSALLDGFVAAKVSAGILTDADSELAASLRFVAPGRSILEKSGLLVNRNGRIQYTSQVVPFPEGTMPEWRFIALLAEAVGVKLLPGAPLTMAEREMTRWYLSNDPLVSPHALTLQQIRAGGFVLPQKGDENNGQAA